MADAMIETCTGTLLTQCALGARPPVSGDPLRLSGARLMPPGVARPAAHPRPQPSVACTSPSSMIPAFNIR